MSTGCQNRARGSLLPKILEQGCTQAIHSTWHSDVTACSVMANLLRLHAAPLAGSGTAAGWTGAGRAPWARRIVPSSEVTVRPGQKPAAFGSPAEAGAQVLALRQRLRLEQCAMS